MKTGLTWLWLALLVIVVDQLSKLYVAHSLQLHETKAIMPLFNLFYTHNAGAAFSLLSSAGEWKRWLLIGIAAGMSIVLLYWLTKTPKHQRRLIIAYQLILGGAIGNLIDRFAYGYVIDFLDLYISHYHWPTANLADVAITTGAVLLVIVSYQEAKQKAIANKSDH